MKDFNKYSFFCHDNGVPQPSQELKEALYFLGEQLHFRLFPLKGRSFTPEGQKVQKENQKTPWRKGWQLVSSDDPAWLHYWLSQGAWAFGVHTGNPLPGGGFLSVVDCDRAKEKNALDGIDYFKDLYKKNNEEFPDDMLSAFTPGGGQHFYFRSQTRLKNEVRKTIPIVDIRGQGGIIVAPGSRLLMNDNTTIKTYRAAQPFPQMKLYDMPEWLEGMIVQRQSKLIQGMIDEKELKKPVTIIVPENKIFQENNLDKLYSEVFHKLENTCPPVQAEVILNKCKEWCHSLETAIEGERNSTLFGTTVCLARLVPHFLSMQLCIELAKTSALLCQRNTQGSNPFSVLEIDTTIQSAICYRYQKGSGMSFSLTGPEPLAEKESYDFEQKLLEKKRIIKDKVAEQQKLYPKKKIVKF